VIKEAADPGQIVPVHPGSDQGLHHHPAKSRHPRQPWPAAVPLTSGLIAQIQASALWHHDFQPSAWQRHGGLGRWQGL